MFFSRKALILSAIGIIATTQVALAKAPVGRIEIGSVVVRYGDLDLGNEADANVLLDRLQDASFQACGGDSRSLSNYTPQWNWLARELLECRKDAVSRAVDTVNAPLLSQVYRGEKNQRLVRETASGRGRYSRLDR